MENTILERRGICPTGDRVKPRSLTPYLGTTSVAEPQTKSLVAGTIWQIWKERNAFIFHGRPPNPKRALEDATSMMLL